jgi:hypothetical protein
MILAAISPPDLITSKDQDESNIIGGEVMSGNLRTPAQSCKVVKCAWPVRGAHVPGDYLHARQEERQA